MSLGQAFLAVFLVVFFVVFLVAFLAVFLVAFFVVFLAALRARLAGLGSASSNSAATFRYTSPSGSTPSMHISVTPSRKSLA
ncbi:hypothetical protein C5L39_00320 [Corynebacterium alimapuense]|uniref:Uncharacterized protein n=1 Tax=Corynebacterium alimapuense TaxID=1576874 RepID=A0A3M8K9P1_9CORY|nr:hypothetical protein C5L39_00320 [Corynebacterium alimapuense]